MINILKELIEVPTASGAEKMFLEKLSEILKERSDETYFDNFGNLVSVIRAKNKNASKSIAFFAPADAAGLIVNHIEENGLIKVSPLGAFNLSSALLSDITDTNINGILLPVSEKAETTDDTCADFGFTSHDEARSFIKEGDVLYFTPSFNELANDKVYGVSLASKLACLALISAAEELKRNPANDYDVYFVFCTQTKLGLRGSYQAAFAISPDISVCIEPYENEKPGIKIMDKSVVCDEQITLCLENAAKEQDIPVNLIVSDSALSDASKVQSANTGCKTGILMLPVGSAFHIKQSGFPVHAMEISRIISTFLHNI